MKHERHISSGNMDHHGFPWQTLSDVPFYSYDTLSRSRILLIRQQDRSFVDHEQDGSFCLFAAAISSSTRRRIERGEGGDGY